MKVMMLKSKIAVDKLSKSTKKSDSFLAPVESGDSMGVIKAVGPDVPDTLKVGMKVYYGTNRTQIQMDGSNVEVMEPDNIFAVVEEDNFNEAQV